MPELTSSVQELSGIGPARAKALDKLGIRTVQDLLTTFPRRYEDRRSFLRIADLPLGESCCVEAMVAEDPVPSLIRRGLELMKLRVVDESGSLQITFFNQSYLRSVLRRGATFIFYGTVEGNLLHRQMTNPLVEAPGQQSQTGAIIPIYPLSAGLSQKNMLQAMRQSLDQCADALCECLPPALRQEYDLCGVTEAFRAVHFPADWQELAQGRRRLVFEELFLLSLGLQLLRQRRCVMAIPPCAPVDLTPFYQALPFSLTNAQRRVIQEATADMCSGRPMNRLCQGDVGSGKTMVAAACIYFAAKNHLQAALMAPTEILARQHYKGLAPLMEKLGIRCALLTGSIGTKARRDLTEQLYSGEIDLCIGTHALLTEDIRYQKLGLVITDEQHRFGVAQRSALAEKAALPHTLVMSATPIPRTLALILYGDLDVSILDELPPGRQHIDTFVVSSNYHPRLYDFIRKLVAQGRQVYIVCPLVEENDQLPDERKAVDKYTLQLQQNVFPQLRLASIHGKMSAREKDAVMTAFAAGEIDVLVSTTVIEVGVDVPNAALMVVENAEQFGFSQLHQLRGRVGRGPYQSYCVLVSDAKNQEAKTRLHVMTQTNDGFRIAQEDLQLRGPGDFFGQRQHGLPGLRMASLSSDLLPLQQAQQAAQALIRQDPDLSSPEHQLLRRQVMSLFEENSSSLN